ncbi:MAG: peptidase M19 [Nevskiales bacterium]
MNLDLRILAIAIAVSLTACGGGSSSDDDDTSISQTPTSQFSVAGSCYNLRSVANNGYVQPADGGYQTGESASAEAFFMQPTTLARYLLLASDDHYLSSGGGSVSSAEAPSDAGIWIVDYNAANESFGLVSESTGQALAVNTEGQLITVADTTAAETRFALVPTSQPCASFPEMPTGITGETYKGNGVDKPVIGFADVHTHMGMSSEMSYDDSVGPSAGGVLFGQVFHRLGVPHALADCEEFHGPNGIRDGNNILEMNPTGTHDTTGWPHFPDWPARNFLTHQVMYYKWVERAWKAGLRVMVNHGTNIAALCRLGQLYALKPESDCDDMSVAVKQIQYLYDVQDYIDAQSGGPGKGWYRIVKSPQEAREVINEGKLAVILGIEVAQVFDCGVTLLPGGIEQRRCDQAQIDAELDRLWDLGVRHVYPFHDIDSSLGGAGIFSGDVINLLNFLDTGQFWQTSECRDWPMDEPTVRDPGTDMTTAVPGVGNDPLTAAVLDLTGGVTPVYPEGKRCNARTVTDLGDYALRALMNKRMIIDIDHAAYHSKDIMLDIAEEQNPPYPMASSHDAHGGLTSDQAVRMLKAGGTIYPYKGNGIKHREFLDKLKFWHEKAGTSSSQLLGLGYGADANGFGGHPGPRGGDSDPVVYPITLFEGQGWPAHLAALPNLKVDLLSIPESGKFWHIDEVGMAHYGLVADFVEEVRLESGEEGLTALYNSAEAFLQMWERVWNRQ